MNLTAGTIKLKRYSDRVWLCSELPTCPRCFFEAGSNNGSCKKAGERFHCSVVETDGGDLTDGNQSIRGYKENVGPGELTDG